MDVYLAPEDAASMSGKNALVELVADAVGTGVLDAGVVVDVLFAAGEEEAAGDEAVDLWCDSVSTAWVFRPWFITERIPDDSLTRALRWLPAAYSHWIGEVPKLVLPPLFPFRSPMDCNYRKRRFLARRTHPT